MRALGLVCVLLAACGPFAPPRDPDVCGIEDAPMRVIVDDLFGGHSLEEATSEAMAMWGDSLVVHGTGSVEGCLTEYCRGSIVVYQTMLDEDVLGDARVDMAGHRVAGCEVRSNSSWDPDPLVIAHEIGHCFGLEHSRDEASVMHEPIYPDATVTDLDREVAAEDTCDDS